jgi:TatD DNase family protein
MKLIDTHSHIYLPEYEADIQKVIINAQDVGVELIILPAIDSTHFFRLQDIVSRYEGYCLPLMGVHPSSINRNYVNELDFAYQNLLNGQYVGIGECGIDLYWDKSFVKEQIIAFETQVSWALEFDLPIIIHQRESFEEIFHVLNNFKEKKPKGIFHCYSGDIKTAEICIEMEFLLGIGGVVSFKKSMMAEVVKEIPLKYLVLETDAPYLAPVPYRGKRNEPAYIQLIANHIAHILNIEIEEVAAITSANAKNLFKL